MLLLLAASLLWAPSFGIIKHNLAGVDANLISFVRMALSFAAFAPWFWRRAPDLRLSVRLGLIGLVQYGLMYMSYTASFRYLPAYVVAISTIFTPLYVTLFNDIWSRRLHPSFWLSAALAVAGTGMIVWRGSWEETRGSVPGVLLVQASNACFAVGQLAYRRVMAGAAWKDELAHFAPMYLGGALVCLPAAAFSTDWFDVSLSAPKTLALAYLGLVPSAAGFFLWNLGAGRVNAGGLAAMNNAKIPLAVAVAFAFFGERPQSLARLAIGAAVIAAAVGLPHILRLRNGRLHDA